MIKLLEARSTESLSLIEQLNRLIEEPGNQIHLVINGILTESELSQLEERIRTKSLPIQKLSLYVNPELIQGEHFLNILQVLNHSSIGLELIFGEHESEHAAEFLTNTIAPTVSFPLQIKEEQNGNLIPITLEQFQDTIIGNIQKRNNQTSTDAAESELPTEKTEKYKTQLSQKKIALKDLIANKRLRQHERAKFVSFEVQHVEQVEQQVVQEEVVEQQAEVQLSEIQQYSGQLVGFEAFQAPHYRRMVELGVHDPKAIESLYDLLKKELFANLPHAIKYLTPSAAEQLALNLPELITLNKDNLPQGFFLKKTDIGEWVLDYDTYLENENANPFTPSGFPPDAEIDPIYAIKFPANAAREWMGYVSPSEHPKHNDLNWNALLSDSKLLSAETPTALINLWIKFGEDGVKQFFSQLKSVYEKQPGIVSFLLHNYLAYIPQWDHLVNSEFFNVLERISHYDEPKLTCFKKFLEHTGSSRHDLTKTVAGFELFWNEWQHLCAQHRVSTAAINTTWSTPQGGEPVVYMERLLFILKNARSLEDQLKGLKDLTLDNYGAYYAAKYEGFRSVAAVMDFDYDYEKLSQEPFNPNLFLYRTDLETLAEWINWEIWNDSKIYPDRYDFYLVDCDQESIPEDQLEQLKQSNQAIPFDKGKFTPPFKLFYKFDKSKEYRLLFTDNNPIPIDNFKALSLRFIGQQMAGITVSSLTEQIDDFINQNFGRSYKTEFHHSLRLFSEKLLATTLCFITHERYTGKPLEGLFTNIKHADIHRDVLYDAIRNLQSLYKRDIKLNDDEARRILRLISDMNTYEFESTKINKLAVIDGLFNELKKNKYATFKFLNYGCSGPFHTFYAIKTCNFFAKDSDIAQFYQDDLLLLSSFLGSELFYEGKIDEKLKDELKQVKEYLRQSAVTESPNNLQYAIQRVIHARKRLTYTEFISACQEISKLETFDASKVDEILIRNKIKANQPSPMTFFSGEGLDLRKPMQELILVLDKLEDHEKPLSDSELSSMSMEELQTLLSEKWLTSGTLLSVVAKSAVKRILTSLKELCIQSAFKMPGAKGLREELAKKLQGLPDFQSYQDFERVNQIQLQAKTLSHLTEQILNNPFVKQHEQAYIALFKRVDFSKMRYESFYSALFLLSNMPGRNYLSLANMVFGNSSLVANPKRFTLLIDILTLGNSHCLPSQYLEVLARLAVTTEENEGLYLLTGKLVALFEKDNKDPIFELVMSQPDLSYQNINKLIQITDGIENHRDKIAMLFVRFKGNQEWETLLDGLISCPPNSQHKILEIISQGHALCRTNSILKSVKEYATLINHLAKLSKDNLDRLYTFFETTPVSADCLFNALQAPDVNDDFEHFLLGFEKEPFGPRDLPKQYDTSEVERVVNASRDLVNNTPFPYLYRKQLMEAFLFVNDIGHDLPVYNHKPAKDLTNAELAELFSSLKKDTQHTPFQKRLLALGLMREAMYRSTGELPYSTQMLAIIDAMMHPGDVISNIDTGQGKSLIDAMKAVLLWLDSSRVDVSTSSLVDAKRDLANYGPFFKLLGIPFSQNPISSTSSLEDFQTEGINYSTFAQLALFFSKAKVMNHSFDTPESRVSLVVNESDYSILDDNTIYRFASSDGAGVSFGQEWIYSAINEFVSRPEFIKQTETSAQEDIDDLKAYLKVKAKALKKSPKIVSKFSDAQYLSWLESALIVNYQLKENEDFVIPDEPLKKKINGKEVSTKVAKVLMKDGKVSPDSTFGNGIQQLLYARLNQEKNSNDFVIEPQHKTIISSNNKNLLAYYRSRKGYIWGSSGTVGSDLDIDWQYKKYGFDFSKREPHQKNRVQFHTPILLPSEDEQYAELSKRLIETSPSDSTAPNLIFCKDIESAKRLYRKLSDDNDKEHPMQLYIGLGQEEEYIRHAAIPGMITITTSALGRNTDIPYNRDIGLNVWHTYVDSPRSMGQKAGRTGRQGSQGQVHYILNQEDLHDKSIEEFKTAVDEQLASERSLNEELYDVLGYLLEQLDNIPSEQFIRGKSEFLTDAWAKFSKEVETRFRESKRDSQYNKEQFITETLNDFNKLVEAELTKKLVISVDDLIRLTEQEYAFREKYRHYDVDVRFSDCTPTTVIACQLLPFTMEDAAPEVTKQSIQAKLEKLFASKTQTLYQSAQDYLHYLFTNPSTQEIVVSAHKEFLTDYLRHQSKRQNFVARWLGFESNLNRITSNQNYLLMFQAYANLADGPVVDIDVMKTAIIALLDEYLDTGWFISKSKREAALGLKEQVQQTNSVEDIIAALSQSQVDIATKDIKANQSSTFRAIKPVNFFGHSRFQTTLNRAINLIASLGAKSDVDVLTSGLTPLLSDLTDISLSSDITLDDLKIMASSKKPLKGNAKVLATSLENAMNIQSQKPPEGMIGRNGLFQSHKKQKEYMKKKEGDENTPPKPSHNS
ncbi:hypothetical protein [Legionella impletisoli]|uniref:Protein translocase subunit SecA n=1 Tax=Legionella impletisoli TaxID=343510 RepID=A0A917N978_9GAMM|nr:hypothetical protein [Legionella impletisoli]GGI78265.1 hypothetical protein GCM10007966_03700 [Legionella impletisoli]